MSREVGTGTNSQSLHSRFDAIIFDLWGTLVANLPASRMTAMLDEVVGLLGAPAEEFTARWKSDGWRKRATGVYSSGAECAVEIAAELGIECDPGDLEEITRIYREFIVSRLIPCPGVLDALARWKSAGFELGLASDCTRETELAWPRTGLAKLIERPVFSSELGIKKPDPRIFQAACQAVDVAPARCLYLADGAGRELEAAAGVGMRVVQILWPGEEKATGEHLQRAERRGPRIAAIEDLEPFLG